jgi:glycosyltransferase involved in cell wall biosynthesis
LKIAVNTRLLLPHKLEGIGWFTYEVFKRVVKNHPEVEWIFIFDRPYDKSFVFADNVKPVVIGPQARHPILWYIWFEHSIKRVLKKHKPDLFISPDGYLNLKTPIKSLAVIHDLNFEHLPQYLPKFPRWYYKKYFRRFAEKAYRIATVSKYSKEDISKTYQIDSSKIDLVYNGIGDFFHPISEMEKQETKNEISSGNPYFIFIGALNPRKNIDGMLKAYSLYREKGGENKFVIVGAKMFWDQNIARVYESHPYKTDILFTGRLEGEGLNKVLASAEALLFVSYFEGFGIPIVEAFKCEVPVITSSTSSMPEIAGDAALICDPQRIEDIAIAMHKVEDPQTKKDLIEKGIKRQNLFTWNQSAEMMWASIEKTLKA